MRLERTPPSKGEAWVHLKLALQDEGPRCRRGSPNQEAFTQVSSGSEGHRPDAEKAKHVSWQHNVNCLSMIGNHNSSLKTKGCVSRLDDMEGEMP